MQGDSDWFLYVKGVAWSLDEKTAYMLTERVSSPAYDYLIVFMDPYLSRFPYDSPRPRSFKFSASNSGGILNGASLLPFPPEGDMIRVLSQRQYNFSVFSYSEMRNHYKSWATNKDTDYMHRYTVYKSETEAFYMLKTQTKSPYDQYIVKYDTSEFEVGGDSVKSAYSAKWAKPVAQSAVPGAFIDVWVD